MLFPGTFGEIVFTGTGKKEIYNRDYKNFVDIFPIITASFQVIYFIVHIISNYFFSSEVDE